MSYASFGFNNMQTPGSASFRYATSSLLVIDSDDRNVASSAQVGTVPGQVELQPWNSFKIQTPDRLATGGIASICLKSIRFPWYIPNITAQNNVFRVEINGVVTDAVLAADFTSPENIAGLLTGQLFNSAIPRGIEIEWAEDLQSFRINAIGYAGVPIIIRAYNPSVSNSNLTESLFQSNASLAKTMGLTAANLNRTFTPTTANETIVVSSSTVCLYTRYVDIVSTRLLQYRRMIDGASKNANKKAIITRVYCANENSANDYDLSGNIMPIGTKPFVIHRKFKEKVMLWNTEATIDYLDFDVYDEYGNLVALPRQDPVFLQNPKRTYPGFQMTYTLNE